MIKPIQTSYNGYRFRSRLEARWAVFFDTCGYEWEYEPEGFELPCGTYYLPDFKIFGEDENGDYNVFWIEVKPSEKGVSDPKVRAFQNAILCQDKKYSEGLCKGYGDYIILDGPPSEKIYEGTLPFNGEEKSRQWYMSPCYRGRPSFWPSNLSYKEIERDYIKIVGQIGKSPIEISRSARFEHGERP